MSKTYLVGSQHFFNSYEDFKSKDTDRVVLVDNPIGFRNCRQTSTGSSCLFEWRNMSAQEFVEVTLTTKVPMCVGKFLIPEFAEAIGFTLEHLVQLEPIFQKLDEKHLYEKIIYQAYIQNGAMTLTQAQLDDAYRCYKQFRKEFEYDSRDSEFKLEDN